MSDDDPQATSLQGLSKTVPSRRVRELLAIGAVFLLLYALCAYFDVFESFVAMSAAHEDWELDDIAIATFGGLIAVLVFYVRQSRWLQREIARSSDLQTSLSNREAALRDRIVEQERVRVELETQYAEQTKLTDALAEARDASELAS